MNAPRGRRRPPPLPPENAASLDTLYRRYSAWLGGVLRRQLGSQAHAAEDLVQEAYIRVSRYGEDDANRHPRALLRRIGVNLARDHMRRHVIRGGLSPDAADESGEMSLLPVVHAEQEHDLQLRQIILGLPPLYRDVFVLSRFTGMTYEEIGHHLGIAVKTVEWRMSKALALCAEQMRE